MVEQLSIVGTWEAVATKSVGLVVSKSGAAVKGRTKRAGDKLSAKKRESIAVTNTLIAVKVASGEFDKQADYWRTYWFLRSYTSDCVDTSGSLDSGLM